MTIAVAVILTVLAIANIVVTALLLRSRLYSRGQQLTQLALIWLLPVIGFITVWYFLREANPTRNVASGFVDGLAVSPVDFGREHDSNPGSHGDDGPGH